MKKVFPNSVMPARSVRAQTHNDSSPRHLLRRGSGVWLLRFEGSEVVLAHSLGLLYLAHLLGRPNAEPVHAITLSLLALDAKREGVALEVPSPGADQPVVVERNSCVIERRLAIDEFDRLQRLRRRLNCAQAVADDPEENPSIRAEADAESQALQQELKARLPLGHTRARQAARSVRRAIVRTVRALYDARDARGEPDLVLQSFAAHLQRYVLAPSTLHFGPGAQALKLQLAGRWCYEPPPGVAWDIS